MHVLGPCPLEVELQQKRQLCILMPLLHFLSDRKNSEQEAQNLSISVYFIQNEVRNYYSVFRRSIPQNFEEYVVTAPWWKDFMGWGLNSSSFFLSRQILAVWSWSGYNIFFRILRYTSSENTVVMGPYTTEYIHCWTHQVSRKYKIFISFNQVPLIHLDLLKHELQKWNWPNLSLY